MNPTSSLITGGVLLFGVAALANLFLPAPAAPVHPLSMASPEMSVRETPASEIPSSPVEIAPPAPATPAPSETPVAAVRVPAAAPVTPSKPVLESGMHRATSALSNLFTHSKTPAVAEPNPSTAAAPIISTPSAPSALPAASTTVPSASNTGTSAVAAAASGSVGAVSLSATAQDRAWLRLGDRKTVMAKTGDTVPGLGKITSINADQITIDGKQVLKVTP